MRETVKQLLPTPVREAARRSLVHFGERTSNRRPLPDFLVIGTKRGGTTSLWRYLLEHPLVPRLFPAWNTKTSHYFEDTYVRGEAWYRSHFPTAGSRAALERRHGGPTRVGESAPLYMYHPLAPQRVADLIPDVRLVVLLRDPVERAWSHWKERRTEGVEPLDFADALAAEKDRTAGERDRLIHEPGYVSKAYDWYSYRARGQYLDHLEGWLDRFDRRQLLVLPSEQLYRSPAATYGQVLQFLGLPSFMPTSFEAHNHRRSAPMVDRLRADLTAHYRPHNAALAQRLGMAFDWAD
jgi:hypothetical protein